jgi:hypothetical protein
MKMHFKKVLTVYVPTSMRSEQRSLYWEESREGGGFGRAYIEDNRELGQVPRSPRRIQYHRQYHRSSCDTIATELSS